MYTSQNFFLIALIKCNESGKNISYFIKHFNIW